MSVGSSLLPPIRKLRSRKWKTLPETGGSVSINDAKLKQGYIGNLQKKSCTELEELIIRQEKILSNTSFIERLPDKGKRLKEKKENLQKALEQARNTAEEVVIPDVDALEWQWRDPRNPSLSSQAAGNGVRRVDNDPLDSDDDEDPLELLANHSSDVPLRIGPHRNSSELDPADAIQEELKKLELMDKIEADVTPTANKTLTQCSDFASDFGSKLIISLEKKSKPPREVFKPFRPLKQQHLLYDDNKEKASDVDQLIFTTNAEASCDKPTMTTHLVDNKSELGPKTNHSLSNQPVFGEAPKLPSGVSTSSAASISSSWKCESSATGFLNSCSSGPSRAKLISLRESVQLEKEALERAKKAQLQEAAARLKTSGKHLSNQKISKYNYKDVNTILHILEKDDDELGDLFTHYRGICVVEGDASSDDSDQE